MPRDKIWVLDTSLLIFLGRIGLIEILPRLSPGLLIPRAVAGEILQGSPRDPARVWLKDQAFDSVQDVGPCHPLVRGSELGTGEEEVLIRFPAKQLSTIARLASWLDRLESIFVGRLRSSWQPKTTG